MTRRKWGMITVVVMLAIRAGAVAPEAPTGLMIELLSQPEKTTITDTQPELSWIVNDPDRNEIQTAYQVLVASTMPSILADEGDVWDSGRIQSYESTAVSYTGPPLTEGFTYYWKVRTWDKQDQISPYSQPQCFKLAESKWDWSCHRAGLINAGKLRFYLNGYIHSRHGNDWRDVSMDCKLTILHRGAGILFHVQDNNNYYYWRLNAEDDSLSLFQMRQGIPKEIHKQSYDFTNKQTYQVRIEVADRTACCLINDRLIAKVQHETGFAHGKVGFRTTTTEMMDVDHVIVTAANGEVLLADDFEKTPNYYRIETQELAPSDFYKTGKGEYFVDFGKAAFGTVAVTLRSKAGGERVVLRLGELKNGQSVEAETPGHVVFYQTELTLHAGTHRYTIALPKHSYHEPFSNYDPLFNTLPFRYCELRQVPNALNASDIQQLAVFYPFDEQAADFECSDPALNAVWDLCKYTIKACSAMGIYIDGHRERQMNEGDTLIQQLSNYCVDREYSLARRSHEHVLFDPSRWTEYVQQSIQIAWNDYLFTGDKESLEKNYDLLKAKSCIALREDNHLISSKTGKVTPTFCDNINLYERDSLEELVDWPRGERDGYVYKTYNTVANAVHHETLHKMIAIARLLGKTADVSLYTGLVEQHKAAFQKHFWHEGQGNYRDGIGSDHASLHANAFALAHGLVPESYQSKVADHLIRKGMVCGTYGSFFLLKALYEAQRGQAALDLMTGTGMRSWHNMIRSGSTMTMESFDNSLKKNLDWNHAWATAPASIIPMYLMGVQPLEPGFAKIQIKPQPGDLKTARLKMPTVRGAIIVGIENNAQEYRLSLKIPCNTRAKVYVPRLDSTGAVVEVNGKEREGVTSDSYIVFDEIGSGEHVFKRSRK